MWEKVVEVWNNKLVQFALCLVWGTLWLAWGGQGFEDHRAAYGIAYDVLAAFMFFVAGCNLTLWLIEKIDG